MCHEKIKQGYSNEEEEKRHIIWKKHMTIKFLDGLQKFGKNFDLMSEFFPGTLPQDLKVCFLLCLVIYLLFRSSIMN